MDKKLCGIYLVIENWKLKLFTPFKSVSSFLRIYPYEIIKDKAYINYLKDYLNKINYHVSKKIDVYNEVYLSNCGINVIFSTYLYAT